MRAVSESHRLEYYNTVKPYLDDPEETDHIKDFCNCQNKTINWDHCKDCKLFILWSSYGYLDWCDSWSNSEDF